LIDDTSIRLATTEDATIIAHHRRAMFHDMGRGDVASLDKMAEMFLPQITRWLSNGDYLGWLAQTDDGKVVAGGGLLVHEWAAGPVAPVQTRRAYVLNIYTEPEFRGRGLARKIMSEIVAYCREQKFSVVWLHASDAGRPIYAAMGFVRTNEMKLLL
jgi:GNAT superfamily N-acetyltransferase